MSDTTVRPRRTINVQVATKHVHRNLVRKPKSEGASEFSGLSLDTVEKFTKDVSSYLTEVSNLATTTIDRADFEELLETARELEQWKPAPKRTAKKAAPLATEKKKEKPVTVKVPAPLLAPKPSLVRKAAQPEEDKPTKVNRAVPANWRYMAENADTESARKWWTEYCAKRMRGEV